MNKHAAILLALTLPTSALAHHGTNAQFNMSESIEVQGIITDIGLVNPHAYVYFDVTDANGEVENWGCEMPAGSALRHRGWTEEMFAPGTAVSITGRPSRAEATGCYVETIALNGGAPLERRQTITSADRSAPVETPVIPERTAWGAPNLAGNWVSNLRLDPTRPENQNRGGTESNGEPRPRPERAAGGPPSDRGQAMGPAPGGRQQLALSELGQEVFATIDKSEGYEGRLDCKPRDFFNDLIFDEHTNQVVQHRDRIILKYGFMDTERTIYLDTREHPAELTPSFAGHSYGYWDGDVLVVDTQGFAPSAIRRGPNVVGVTSEQYHTVERFSVDHEKGELTVEYIAEDPLYWAEGQTMQGSNTIYRSEHAWEPYNCDDRSVE